MEGSLTVETILNELRSLKPEFARRFGVSRLGLFGSFVRGEAGPDSDIDVVIELDRPDLFALVHIKEELESDFQRKVDLIPLGPSTNGFLRSRIQREAIYV